MRVKAWTKTLMDEHGIPCDAEDVQVPHDTKVLRIIISSPSWATIPINVHAVHSLVPKVLRRKGGWTLLNIRSARPTVRRKNLGLGTRLCTCVGGRSVAVDTSVTCTGSFESSPGPDNIDRFCMAPIWSKSPSRSTRVRSICSML